MPGMMYKKGGAVKKGAAKFQEGGRVRAGNAGMTAQTKAASRQRNADIEARIRDEEFSAQEQARAERATGGRYQDPPRPRRATAGDERRYGSAAAGNPRGVSSLENFLGSRSDGVVRGEDVRPGGDFSIGRARNLAYGRADQAAMEADVDREVKRRMSDERAYKKGGMVNKKGGMMKKYQEGGPVRQPGKRRIMEGGPKGLPMMTPEQRRMARESMTPEERREADAPLTAEEVRRMGSAFKKGGMVKKKAGGMIKAKGKK